MEWTIQSHAIPFFAKKKSCYIQIQCITKYMVIAFKPLRDTKSLKLIQAIYQIQSLVQYK
jgi:hypothetical protein